MFHYVRPEGLDPLPHLNVFNIEKFKKFLNEKQNDGFFISPKDFFDCINKNTNFPKNSHLLTFDDGLSCHYKYVFPELIERDIKALFFIPSGPFLLNNLLTVHKTHCIYGNLGYSRFRELFMLKSGINHDLFDESYVDIKAKEAYPYDVDQIANFKYAINYILKPSFTNPILNNIIETIQDFDKIEKYFYLTKNNIKEMSKFGMVFGYHGYSHKPFSKIDNNDLKNEFHDSKIFFIEATGESPISVSYPYGDNSSITEEKIDLIKTLGVKFGFMAEDHPYINRMRIPRLDCNAWTN